MPRFLIAASLAALMTPGAAQAHDPARLPRKAEDSHPNGCEGFGPGFTRVQGSDTCVRLSGDVRVEVGFGGGRGATPLAPAGSR